ncbi:MAG TPA: porin family protein [Rhizobium sp.]|nr:porin family protein [Rhizobium sp.]
MKPANVLLATVACLAAIGGRALAADESLLANAPEVTIAGDTSRTGWYVRGDLGYSPWIGNETPSYSLNDAGGASLASGDFDNARFSKPFSGGLGIGYQFTDVLRADLTGEFFRGDFSGTARSAQPCSPPAPAGTGCSYGGQADFRAYGLMANGYVDLANLAGFTPYVGAGIGATNVSWGTFGTSVSCVDGASACTGANFSDERFGGESSWRFSYALMAGVSYDVTDRVKVDIGYRFSDIAGGAMFKGANGSSGSDAGLTRHEFRAGLRVTLW